MTINQLEALITESVNENAANACSAIWGVNIDEVFDFINVDGSEEQKTFRMIRTDLIRNFDVNAFVERLEANTIKEQ